MMMRLLHSPSLCSSLSVFVEVGACMHVHGLGGGYITRAGRYSRVITAIYSENASFIRVNTVIYT